MSIRTLMHRTSLLAALVCIVAAPAHAVRVLGQAEDAYEVQLGDVQLPQSDTGLVFFQRCEDCRRQSLRVRADTIYTVNGAPMTREQALREVSRLRTRNGGGINNAVYLFYDKESKTVNRMVVNTLVQPTTRGRRTERTGS